MSSSDKLHFCSSLYVGYLTDDCGFLVMMELPQTLDGSGVMRSQIRGNNLATTHETQA